MKKNILAVASFVALIGTIGGASAQYYGPPPGPRYGGYGGGANICAYENQYCRVGGVARVGYGAQGIYTFRRVRGGIPCGNQFFGDPVPGVPKHCIVAY